MPPALTPKEKPFDIFYFDTISLWEKWSICHFPLQFLVSPQNSHNSKSQYDINDNFIAQKMVYENKDLVFKYALYIAVNLLDLIK